MPFKRPIVTICRHRPGWRRGLLGLALCCALLPGAHAQSSDAFKLVYIFNFLKYTTWPATPDQYELCLVGKHGLEPQFPILTGKEIGGRPVRLRTVDGDIPPKTCSLVYLPQSEIARLPRILAAIGKEPTLTVSDFVSNDGGDLMLSLLEDGGRLRFIANNTLARANGLVFSSRLLFIAQRVR